MWTAQAQPPPSWTVTVETFSVLSEVERYMPSVVASQMPLSSPTTDWITRPIGPYGPP